MTMATDTTPAVRRGAAVPEKRPVISFAVALADIDESPSNPRKTFRAVDELAADVKRHGVLEPVLVRTSPVNANRYELVFGARRYRASKLAGLEHIPAMIRTLTDEQVLELQVAENSEREDLHPMEEAEAYRALHEVHGWSVEDVAARFGRPVATVRQRLKLCGLIPAGKVAFLEGKMTAGVALIVARIPNEKLQADALEALKNRQQGREEPLTVQDFGWVVQQQFMLLLSSAPFDRAAKNLTAAPDCASCPKRTGNQAELFPELAAKEDMCTDPTCWDAKKVATWDLKAAEAKTKGLTVLSDRQAKSIFSPYGSNEIAFGAASEYVDLDARTYGADGKDHKNRSLIKGAGVPVILARDPSGRARELVHAADFKAAAKAAGNTEKLAPTRAPSRSGKAEGVAALEKIEREKEAKKRAAHEARLSALLEAVHDRALPSAFWNVLAAAVIRAAWSETRTEVCRRLGIDLKGRSQEAEPLLLEVAASAPANAARSLVVQLLVSRGRGDVDDTFKSFVSLYADDAKKKPATKKKAKR